MTTTTMQDDNNAEDNATAKLHILVDHLVKSVQKMLL